MNKQFIEFMKKSPWKWWDVRECFVIRAIVNMEEQWEYIEAKPEDLLGHQMAFVLKEGYFIDIKQTLTGKFTWAVKKIRNNFLLQSYWHTFDYGEKNTYLEASQAAFDKFIELIEA